MKFRLAVYFLIPALTTAYAALKDSMTTKDWIGLVLLSLANGLTALKAYLDETGFPPALRTGNPPKVPADVEDDLPRR